MDSFADAPAEPVPARRTPAVPTLDGVGTAAAADFARRRVAGWRRSCQGAGRIARFSLVRCADVAVDPFAGDSAWWDARPGPGARDLGVRIDVALRLLASQRVTPVVALWSRTGPNELLQGDLGWAAAVRHAAGDRAVRMPSLLVVTRRGWLCLPAGTSRTWKRLRTDD